MALIQGMENANKTRVRFRRHLNGGFLEGWNEARKNWFSAVLPTPRADRNLLRGGELQAGSLGAERFPPTWMPNCLSWRSIRPHRKIN